MEIFKHRPFSRVNKKLFICANLLYMLIKHSEIITHMFKIKWSTFYEIQLLFALEATCK